MARRSKSPKKRAAKSPSERPVAIWAYRPEPLLYQMKHPNRLGVIKKSVGHLAHSLETVSAGDRDRIHPSLRGRVPAGSSRQRLVNLGRRLADAEHVAKLPFKKLHHLPAVIDASEFVNGPKKPGEIYQIDLTFSGHPEAEKLGAKLASRVFLSPLGKSRYLVVSYGIQGSTRLSALPHDHSLHRVYDYVIPTQSLALVSTLLKRVGKQGKDPVKLYVTGAELMKLRKGIDSTKAKEWVSNSARLPQGGIPPEDRKLLAEALENWSTRTVQERENLVHRVVPWHTFIFIPSHVISRNYDEIPRNLGGKRIGLGLVVPEEVNGESSSDILSRLSYYDPHFHEYQNNPFLDVHELDVSQFAPMGRFLRKSRATKRMYV